MYQFFSFAGASSGVIMPSLLASYLRQHLVEGRHLRRYCRCRRRSPSRSHTRGRRSMSGTRFQLPSHAAHPPQLFAGRQVVGDHLISAAARSARRARSSAGRRPEWHSRASLPAARFASALCPCFIEREQVGIRVLIADEHEHVVERALARSRGHWRLLKGPSGIPALFSIHSVADDAEVSEEDVNIVAVADGRGGSGAVCLLHPPSAAAAPPAARGFCPSKPDRGRS